MATREEILAELSAGKIDAAEAGRQVDQLESGRGPSCTAR